MRINDKGTIVVTGGGRGIGAAVARRAGLEGFAVCANYLTDSRAAIRVVQEIKDHDSQAIAFQADIADADNVAAMFETARNELGPIRALVNNAGIPGRRTKLAEANPADLRRVLDTNLLGALLCSREAARHMRQLPGGMSGSIINLSSQVVRTGGWNLATYTASKAGIEGLSLALSRELAADGIRVNVISPGIIDTEQQTFPDKETRQRVEQEMPLGRLGTVDEVANAVLWLISDAASYITGAVVPIAGGR